MARYLVVSKKGAEDVQTRFYNQLLDGVAAMHELFNGKAAEDVNTARPVVNVERTSLVLELHDEGADAFMFRVPQFASQKLMFEAQDRLSFVGVKPNKNSISFIRQSGEHICVAF